MNDLNKLAHTKVGDNIDYYINGVPEKGTVVKMNNSFVSVLKADGTVSDIHVNDTFFVKDIIKESKTWNGMTGEERTEALIEAHAFSPRFLSKTWEDLPQELKDVLQKTNIEESTHGQIGGNRAGVSTDTDIKTPEDYKGETDDRDKQTKEEFKHDNDKPTVDKNNGMEKDHKKKDQFDGMKEDWRNTGGDSDKHKIKSAWESWLEKDALDPKAKPQSDLLGDPNTATVRNTRIGQKPPQVRETASLNIDAGSPDKMIGGHKTIRDSPTSASAYAKELAGKVGEFHNDLKTSGRDFNKIRKLTEAGEKMNRSMKRSREQAHDWKTRQNIADKWGEDKKKSYGKPLYGVTTLDKEGDGAGNSGVNSLETTGVYNARYSDNKGRYRDQEKDKE